jgi:hypothetical protein
VQLRVGPSLENQGKIGQIPAMGAKSFSDRRLKLRDPVTRAPWRLGYTPLRSHLVSGAQRKRRSSFAQQALNILRLVEVLGGLEPIGAASLADTRSAARKSVPAIVTARCVLAPAGGYRGRAVMPLTTHNITGLSQRTGEGHRPVAVVSRVALLNA